MRRLIVLALGVLALSLGACVKRYDQAGPVVAVTPPAVAVPEKGLQTASLSGVSLGAVEVFAKKISCVPYARDVSGIEIRGDAWTWWDGAAGHYARGTQPKVGSVIVMKKGRKLDRGHVGVVMAVLNAREIQIDHANWRHGEVHRGALVRDVSAKNDWSLVQVWYPPIGDYGTGQYAIAGFIYQPTQTAKK